MAHSYNLNISTKTIRAEIVGEVVLFCLVLLVRSWSETSVIFQPTVFANMLLQHMDHTFSYSRGLWFTRVCSAQPSACQSQLPNRGKKKKRWPLRVLIAQLTERLDQKGSKNTHSRTIQICSGMELSPRFYGGTVNKLIITSWLPQARSRRDKT